MKVVYTFSDRRDKEADIARMGFPHEIRVLDISHETATNIVEWCKENLNCKWFPEYASIGSKGADFIYDYVFYISDFEEAFLFRLRWS